jgi:hypothetical protein
MLFTIPNTAILSNNQKLNWINRFYNYFNITFQPDTSKLDNIIISDFFANKLRYQLERVFKLPPDENSDYVKSVKSILDSLQVLEIIDTQTGSEFSNKLFSIINKSVPYFRNLHVNRDDSLINAIGDNLPERIQLLDNNRKEFQEIVDNKINTLYEQMIQPTLMNKFRLMTKNFSDKEPITLLIIREINSKYYLRTKDFLSITIFKNPYLDLPLNTRTVLLILMVITPFVYFYFTVLQKYYSNIEKKIELYNHPDIIKTSSIRNINRSINLIPAPDTLLRLFTSFITTFLPLTIIVIYSIFLFSEELYITIILILSFTRISIWLKIDNPSTFNKITNLLRK